jgi:hypothetical protein
MDPLMNSGKISIHTNDILHTLKIENSLLLFKLLQKDLYRFSPNDLMLTFGINRLSSGDEYMHHNSFYIFAITSSGIEQILGSLHVHLTSIIPAPADIQLMSS